MEFIYSIKTMEEIICYWIEAHHISTTIENLAEYTDEAAEMYDTAEWFSGDDIKGLSLMGVVNGLDEVGELASKIRFNAEDKLKWVIEGAIDAGNPKFEKYQGKDYHKYMDDVIESLYEEFDRIYEYEQPEQIENFYEVLIECMDDIIK